MICWDVFFLVFVLVSSCVFFVVILYCYIMFVFFMFCCVGVGCINRGLWC